MNYEEVKYLNAWAEINLDNLKSNIMELRELMPGNCMPMPVIKANAYGHGAIVIAQELSKIGIKMFAVSNVFEAIQLRENNVNEDILILGITYRDNFSLLNKFNLTQTLVNYEYAKELSEFGEKIKVHVGIESGMNRLGEKYNHIEEIIQIYKLNNIEIDGIFTHLCVADSSKEEDIKFTKTQIENFYSLVKALQLEGIDTKNIHIQNSFGLLNYRIRQCNFARFGIILYGVKGTTGDYLLPKNINIKPVLSLKSKIVLTRDIAKNETVGYGRNFCATKDCRIAVVSIGYADGLPRNLSCGVGAVLIKGKRAQIISNICMDHTIIDITDIEDVKSGDVVTIIGQDGNESILAEDIATKANTITYEIFCGIGPRITRIYV